MAIRNNKHLAGELPDERFVPPPPPTPPTPGNSMVICGPHIVDASNVAYIQQVNTDNGRSFVVTPKFGKSRYPLFLTEGQLRSLLAFWGLNESDLSMVKDRPMRRRDWQKADDEDKDF